jgi:hypothetical protein
VGEPVLVLEGGTISPTQDEALSQSVPVLFQVKTVTQKISHFSIQVISSLKVQLFHQFIFIPTTQYGCRECLEILALTFTQKQGNICDPCLLKK